MTREIVALSNDAYSMVKDLIPRAIVSESIDVIAKTADIVLSEAVILKSYNNGVILDLGARTVGLEPEDFRRIEIR